MKIAIVGAGWYGCHIALALQKAGHHVTLFEKNADIFQQISGTFGIRLHAGPHYPRSSATRINCREGFTKFKHEYPELLIKHDYSIYGLGRSDANNQPSKVSPEQFNEVCKEVAGNQAIDTSAWGYKNLISATNIDEPSIAVGASLRETFRKKLRDANVNLVCNIEIKSTIQHNKKIQVSNDSYSEEFDSLINASSYQSLLPNEDFPFDMEVVYQPCIALTYKDMQPGTRPFSFIVMDGWFPCLMPSINQIADQTIKTNEYLMTHGKWTIMGSFKTGAEADNLLASLNDTAIENKIKGLCEQEMNRFWPAFGTRFKYTGWKGTVLAKLKTESEFRSAVTFEKNGIIHIIPGKINNIFDAEEEVLALLNNENILEHHGYHYVRDGVLATSLTEITKKPKPEEQNTCSLQTWNELKKTSSPHVNSSIFASSAKSKPRSNNNPPSSSTPS